ncbi:hypothetical protein PIROE2DRAFT_1708 [Piromyces sp. E2]|nr:hypothetical protein PIROE2DRAFT_1708 [Piromyces sp. E2]|eukprot:OUM70284.1 hypothetical protein PIROE2DRAFT_1708 [Piromyces sp. E2]
MTKLPTIITIDMFKNIFFIGNESGTIFDYKNQNMGILFFSLFENENITLGFENISFENFQIKEFRNNNANEIISIHPYITYFHVIFNRCSFKNNYSTAFSLITKNSKSKINIDEPTIKFQDCGFYDNPGDISINFNNTTFVSNSGLIFSHYSNIIFDTCNYS